MRKKQKRSTFGAICDDVMKKHGNNLDDKRDFTFVKSSRKENRKQKRKLLKQRKNGVIMTTQDEPSAVVNVKSQKTKAKSTPKLKPKSNISEQVTTEPKSVMDELKSFNLSVEKTRKRRIAENVNIEDKTISQLEKKLRINTKKKKKLPSSFKADGFDYILDLIDDIGEEKVPRDKTETQKAMKSTKKDHKKEIIEDEDNFFASDKSDIIEEDENIGSDLNEELFDEVESDIDCDETGSDKSDDCDEIVEEQTPVNAATKYVPPALRDVGNGKNFAQLQRQLKGLLNRVSESNLNKIANDIEQMYRENSRAIMNKVFSGLIMTSLFQPDPIPDKLNMEYAMLVCVISRRVAIEVLAYVLEDVVCKLNDVLNANKYDDSKSTNNAVALICNFYRLKITHGTLPVDLLNLFSESFTEKNVELILHVLRLVGFQLRQDDPVSFKDIVQRIVSKTGDVEEAEGTRMAFMMDTLTAIKNNNARKLTQYYDPDMVKQIRKKVSVAVGNTSSGSVRLPAVTMDDFVHGDTNGRWWVVGSAWAGVPMLKKKDGPSPASEQISSKLVEAARKQRMNTDLRRSIFYAIMTADDFVNAFEKILSLGLKDRQIQEIPHVIVECCQQGKQYNAFYCHLLSKFCGYDRQNILRTQCSFWDRFKLLSDFKQRQMSNLAALLSDLVFNTSLPLSVLKNIDFTQLDITTAKFLKLFFKNLVEKPGVDNEVFKIVSKLALNKKYKLLSQGLILFLNHFVINEESFEKDSIIYKTGINNLLKALKSNNKISAVSL